MRLEEITTILRREPFTPLRICLADGKRYEIHHPHMIILSSRAVAIGVRGRPGVGIADHVILCTLQDVIRVEEVHAATYSWSGTH
jgi:hypothetical protein